MKFSMKFVTSALVASFVLLLVPTAKAIVQIPGTFMAAQCGSQAVEAMNSLNVQEVCIGELAGSATEAAVPAVAFRLNDGSMKLFRIAQTSNPLVAFMNGEKHSVFFLVANDGEQASMNVIRARDGAITGVFGEVSSIHYRVEGFQPVFIMQ